MAKLSLKADPTFTAVVSIPKAGAEPVQIKITCKHRTKDELQEFVKSRSEKSDTDSILAMASGWDLEDAFNAENIEAMCQNYIAAPLEIYKAYVSALVGERAKN